MIERIVLQNFKSISTVALNLNQFNCLIGLNGSGKSTILQSLDFISQLMIGDIQNWLNSRSWVIQDTGSKFKKATNSWFRVYFRTRNKRKLMWLGNFNRT